MICKLLSIVVAFVAIVLGILLTSIPGQLGLYQWIASVKPELYGFTPSFLGSEDEWGFTFQQLSQADLTGQTALVTGGNSGVGYETVLGLARLGASVTIACRNQVKCSQAAETVRADPDVKESTRISTLILDTSSLTLVQSAANHFLEQHQVLDLLYLNAGIYSSGCHSNGTTYLSEDGIEAVFATNHVGHHLLYKKLEPLLQKSKMARVVLTSSSASFVSFPYKVATDLETLNNVNVYYPPGNDMKIYGQSKLAQVLFAQEVTRRLGPDSNIYANAAHPGAAHTGIWDKNPFIPKFMNGLIMCIRRNVMWTAQEGALTLLYLGVAQDALREKQVRGQYFHPQSHQMNHPLAQDLTLQRKVWDFCDELVTEFL